MALSPVLLVTVTAVVDVETPRFVVVLIELVETAVTNPLASTVIVGTNDEDP